MPGSGKSTIGKILAQSLKLDFIDSDAEIEKTNGMSIEKIFAIYGELYFREQETAFLTELKPGPHVVATGGGMPMFNNNFEKLKAQGLLIYLSVTAPTLCSRIMGHKKGSRPLLSGVDKEDLSAYLLSTLLIRRQVYEQSDLIVDAEQRPEMVVKDIMNMLQKE